MADRVNENLRGFINAIESGREIKRRQAEEQRKSRSFEREESQFATQQALREKELELKTLELMERQRKQRLQEESLNQFLTEMEASMKNSGAIPKNNQEKYAEHQEIFEQLGDDDDYGKLKTSAGKIRNIANKTQGFEVDYGKMIEDRFGIPIKSRRDKEITPEKIFNTAAKIADRELGEQAKQSDIAKYMSTAESILTGKQIEKPTVQITSDNPLPGMSAGVAGIGTRTPTQRKKKNIERKKQQATKQTSQTVRVKHITSGQTGTIPENEFDSSIYERL